MVSFWVLERGWRAVVRAACSRRFVRGDGSGVGEEDSVGSFSLRY
jgi:hypothetical protein